MMQKRITSEVLKIEHLTSETYILSIKNPGKKFAPGQYMILSIPGDKESREYSVYNRAGESDLQFLIREVEDGYLSSKLKNLKVGDRIEVEGPFGFFTIPKSDPKDQKYVFIATGTGISPMHSIINTKPDINHQLIHGVRNSDEMYDHTDYKNYQACISSGSTGDFHGRVTDFIKAVELSKDVNYYLSGNSAMIDEVTAYLLDRQVSFNKINTEIYF